MKRALIILFLAVLSALPFGGCETNKGEIIPYVRVDIYQHILSPPIVYLGDGESAQINGGYKGIIIYRESDLNYQAYDRTCTMWPDHSAAVIKDTVFEGVYKCPECESQYLLINEGQALNGPARYPLVRYKTSISGNDILHIYN